MVMSRSSKQKKTKLEQAEYLLIVGVILTENKSDTIFDISMIQGHLPSQKVKL